MFARCRAGLAAALIVFVWSSAFAADKAFVREDLAQAAIRLEAQIKADAGQVGKSAAQLKGEADAAFQRNDFRLGLQLLGQLVAVAPQDAANWLRLARTVQQIRPANAGERAMLSERAATAAYLAYTRGKDAAQDADALAIIAISYAERRVWRPALDAWRHSLDLRENAERRAEYERLREQHGFRLLDFTVDADSASPRACFQFSERLPARRTDFSPFVAVAGQDRPAISVDEKQLCVEGLKHGERYAVTLRAGLPSVVKETLPRSAELSVYVRDRKPLVRFTNRAYVLPRTGQQGIPVVSVNTDAIAIEIYRIGDRNLLNTVLDSDFQRALSRYELERLADQQGMKVWSGQLAVERMLNTDVTTAFPVDEAVGALKPGVYVMTAAPKGIPSDDDYGALATQWFIVSDLGLTSFSGNDGVHVFVHSLASAEPKGQIEVRLLSRANEVLAAKHTDANGHVQFEANLARGEGGAAPALLVASDGKTDYAFLSLKTPGFDLSDRGVAGRRTPAGLDAFVYTERGVYRSGETVHITALLRDAAGVAAPNAPLTLVVERPDGVEYRRVTLPDQGLGGRSLSLPLVASASTGTWRVRAYADPKRPAIGESAFMVEDYVPDRLEFELKPQVERLARNIPAEIALEGRFLYGAPAAHLDLEGEVVVAPAASLAGFAGYRFGAADDEFAAEQQTLDDLPQTDARGQARFTVNLDKLPQVQRLLEARIAIRMAEAGGRAVERKITLPVAPSGDMIGVKPLFSGKSLGENEQAGFDVVVVQPDGKAAARQGLRYELLKIESRYQWYRQGGSWNYEPIKSTRRVADGTLDVAAGAPGRIALPVTWGRYRLEVSDASGALTSVAFDAGFYAEASADTPDLLELALDKPEYRAGDNMNVAVTARSAGRLTLNVVGDRMIATQTADVKAGLNTIRLTVGKDWGNGAYMVATLRRPLDVQQKRMPGRAIGVQWFSVDRKARTLALEMKTPETMRPNSPLRIPVKVDGLAAGEEARIVIAAVDVGILNLTNYKSPAPDEHYFGQRRLSADIRDLYGQLIDGMQGTRGQIRSGGDGTAAELQGSPPAQKPLALYSGIVTVKPDGTAEVVFDIPAFAGTARVMAVAFSRDKLGAATTDVIVRDPVVVTATLPRFLLAGDRGTLHLELDNVEGQAGDYLVSVKTDGAIAVEGHGQRPLHLRAKQRDRLSLALSGSRAGAGEVTIRITGPNGFAAERGYPLTVKPATQVATRRTVKQMARGESVTLSSDLFADLVPGSGQVAISVAPSAALDAATLLKALDRYPFGCSEQIASRALPLLYVNELASAQQLALDTEADQRIRDSIDRLLARQGANGSFGLWSVGGDDPWLDAYVTDFLTRARERGFAVPDTAFRLALDRLRNVVAVSPEPNKDGGRDLAYALYVLARNGAAPLGDLRYIADARLNDLATPIAKAQIAAALGLLGDKSRAERAYAAALDAISPQPKLEFGRTDYGSILRDAAALVTLASESNAPRQTVAGALSRIDAARNLSAFTSTQENAWLVLAARAISRDKGGISLNVNGEVRQGTLFRNLKAAALQTSSFVVTNNGEETLQAVVSVSGAPLVPEPAAERGFVIERDYYTLEGEKTTIAQVKQNQRIVVVLKVTERQPQFGRIVVADYLPAGFEIDNPRLVSSGDTGTLGWIDDAVQPVHSEFRDDRFTAAFERKAKDTPVFTVAYVVRAVSPGRYVVPQAYVEDMYRPDRFGRTGTGEMEVVAAR
jgi:uncharacterized protein YfaS (alpha-2-macroglobulin family)